ncbi:MAG: HAMP domain-containing sensor histidine kinase [Pseudoxanthomonas sp.]
MPLHSLSSKLMAAACAGLVAATAAGAGLLSLQIRPKASSDIMRAELAEEVAHIVEGMQVEASGKMSIHLNADNTAIYDAMPRDAAYEVTNRAGHVVAHSPEGVALHALRGMQRGTETIHVAREGYVIPLAATETGIMHHGVAFNVRVARSHRLVSTLRGHAGELYLRALIVTTMLAMAVFLVVVYVTVRCLLRPITSISVEAARVSPRNLDFRLDGSALPTELRPLVAAFNTALDRLEQGFRVQQQFLASAAHELKTPLALIQGEIELGGVANRALLLRDTALMARQVHQLLQLAEVSEGHNFKFAVIEILPILEDALHYLQRLGDQHEVTLVLLRERQAAPRRDADSAAVFVLAKNLLENAILHSPPGASVFLTLSEGRFSVQDQGPGVTEEDRQKLFRRFWRGRMGDREGAGLGLSICGEICEAHDWSIGLATTQDEEGARFVVTFAAPAEVS